MANHNDTGKKGEELAWNFVNHMLNFHILEKNYRVGRAEIDIIAIDDDKNYHLIEVKTRTTREHDALLAVDKKKLKLLADAGEIYKEEKRIEAEFFIDIVTIEGDIDHPTVHYFSDVYYDLEDN